MNRTSSSHHSPIAKPAAAAPPMLPPPPPPLSRFGSAPGSLLASLADSAIAGAAAAELHPFFSGDSLSLTSESTCKNPAAAAAGAAAAPRDLELFRVGGAPRPYAIGEMSLVGGGGGGGGGGGNPLVRHSSSPVGFFSNLIADNGFSLTRDGESYSRQGSDGDHAMAGNNRRLRSQLSFSRQQSALSQISEIGLSDMGESSHSDEGNAGHSLVSNAFSIGTWDEANSIIFSAPASKRGKDNNGDTMASLSHIESQFGLPRSSLEMATMEKILQIQQDQVPFKIRAKRGCATHPRSIAERERRTRISEKLRKLQELVPNMDKQTNTADMLDLAIQHIKGLQSQVQILSQERDNCTCGSKRERN